MTRILTAAAGIPVLILAIWSPWPQVFAALAAIAGLIALSEFYALAHKVEINPYELLGYTASVIIAVCFMLDHRPWIIFVFIATALVSLTLSVARTEEMSNSIASSSATLFGVAYIGLTVGCLIGVRMIADSLTRPPTAHLASKLLTMFFAMVMLTDTGAYYVGRSLGEHKLAPQVSPGKTIEGSIGGVVAAIASGPLCKLIFFHEIPLWHAIALGAAIGLVGQVGDLAESMLKRGSQVKDSGTLLPGHGGMLDRIDSILFCAPVLYYYSRLFL